MKTYSRLTLALFMLTLIGCGDSPEKQLAASKDEIETAELFHRLQIRGEHGYLPNADKRHTGWLKKFYTLSEQVYFVLMLDHGKPTKIRMWYANGSPALISGISREHGLKQLINHINQFENLKNRRSDQFFNRPYWVDGLFTAWHENGQKSSEGHYKNNRRVGLWTFWYENGQKKAEGYWHEGKPEGAQSTWHENGQKFDAAIEKKSSAIEIISTKYSGTENGPWPRYQRYLRDAALARSQGDYQDEERYYRKVLHLLNAQHLDKTDQGVTGLRKKIPGSSLKSDQELMELLSTILNNNAN